MRKLIRAKMIGAIAVLLAATSCTTAPQSAALGAALFSTVNAQGCEELLSPQRSTLIVVEPASNRRLVCNAERAGTRFIPASTYKIPHALIALETEVVSDIEANFEWDSRDRGVPAWNRDLKLGEAISASAVWVFQGIASRLGSDTEAGWVKKFEYGNENVGTASDLLHFWLSGPLEISANEQIQFLMRLVARELAVSERSTAQVIAALRVGETAEGYAIYGKTGAMLPIDDAGFLRMSEPNLLPARRERTGWFVGWIDRPETKGGAVYFAHNLDLTLPGAMGARTEAVYMLLARNGLPSP